MRDHKQFKKELYRRRDEKLQAKARRSRILTACVSLALVIGVLFGFLPANKAATLNPIDALRNE